MKFWSALKASYSDSVAYVIAFPLLALFPVVFEMIQHVAEVHLGMYDGIAAAKAVEHDPLRMGLGLLKVAGLTMPAYWVARFITYRDPARVSRAEAPAVRLFAGVFVFQIVFAAVQLFLPVGSAWGELAIFVIGMAIGILMSAWGVAAPLGNAKVGPRASAGIMWRQLPWTFGFSLTAMLPLMIPHYLFADLAIFGSRIFLWPILLVDSLLVGFLAAVLAAADYHAAMRAAVRAGIPLAPEGVALPQPYGSYRPAPLDQPA